MRIDLLYFDPKTKAVGFIDSKLGSPFHYEPTPETVQPARYLECLLQLDSAKRFFIFALQRRCLANRVTFRYYVACVRSLNNVDVLLSVMWSHGKTSLKLLLSNHRFETDACQPRCARRNAAQPGR